MSGNCPDMNLPATHFDKILIYSVLHYMSNRDEVLNFIERTLYIFKPDGRMLLGDVPNISKKFCFGNSKSGQEMAKNWAEQMKGAGSSHLLKKMESDSQLITFDNALVLGLMAFIRGKGFEAFLLLQPIDLLFGGSREDILVVTYG